MMIRLGETRQVGIEVISKMNEDFEILNASVALHDRNLDKIEDLLVDVQEHKVITLFTPKELGNFYIVFTYRVASEVLKASVLVQVMR